MWRGHENLLVIYGIAVCNEWMNRGFQDTCMGKIIAANPSLNTNIRVPDWLTDDRLYISHQSNLVRKDPAFYGPIFDVTDDLPYYWPV